MFPRNFAAFLLLALPPASVGAPTGDDGLDNALKKLVDVYAVAEAESADPVSAEKAFYEGAIPGMLRRLDPHSVFFDPAQFEQLKELQKSTRKGFGTVVSLLPGRVTILQTMPGTPSERAGLSPGDEILAVNGYELSRLDIDQLAQLLGQARQQQARLDVRRPGNARLLQFTMSPEDMDSPSVERAWLIRPGIAYLRVGSFEAQTGEQIRAALEKLGGQKLKGLVLDLRNNPGGVLPAALETAGLFLKPGQKILSVKGRSAKQEDAVVPSSAKPYDFPVAILVNGKTASASEIVAGALQDHKRAIVVGEPTFGKGLVQSVYNLSRGTGLALTTAFYYTPSGKSIQRHLTGQLDAATVRPMGEGTGGIQPDQLAYGEPPSRLRAVLELSNSLTTYATTYIQQHRGITASFQVTPTILDDLRAALSQRNIQPSIAEWSSESAWIASRLRQEILNQALGVEEGDKVEAERDPVVQAGLDRLVRH